MVTVYETDEFLPVWEEMAEIIGTVGAFWSGLSRLVSLAAYVLTALAIYTIARRRGISQAWMAWVPVLQLWILGSISDHYQHFARERETARRKTLIWLSIAQVILVLVSIAMVGVVLLSFLGAGYTGWDDMGVMAGFFGSAAGMAILILGLCGVTIAVTVIRFIALFDVFQSCVPEHATAFLVLSIFFSVAQPVLLMVAHRNDDGMPKSAVPGPEPKEPWENESV